MGDDYDLITALIFPKYELALKAQGVVDFDDLILMPARLLREHDDVRRRLVGRYKYLLVDEYQDTNKTQLELVKLLSGDRGNVCVVGDDDQSIYSWRGAEVQNILNFDRYFPAVREVRLEQNYRSTQAILDAANAVIAKNLDRKVKRLWTSQGLGDLLKVVVCPDEEEEGLYIGREISRLVKEGGRLQDIAVLYRTNLQSRPIEEALREDGLAYEVVGGPEFYDRKEVKDLVSYFKAINNDHDEVSFLRIVNVPARGIGDASIEKLSTRARDLGIPLDVALRRAEEYPEIPKSAGRKVVEFLDLIDRYRKRFETDPLGKVAEDLIAEIALKDACRLSVVSAAAAARKISAIDSVVQSLTRYADRDRDPSLDAWLKRLALDAREEDGGPDSNTVTLMTLHAAKGLEWPVVFLCGWEEDLVPHGGMQGEAQNLDEERRLAYVGITRARERLYISRAKTRMKRGKTIERTPSRFLLDIPKELCELVDYSAIPKGPAGTEEKNFFADLRAGLKARPGTDKT